MVGGGGVKEGGENEQEKVTTEGKEKGRTATTTTKSNKNKNNPKTCKRFKRIIMCLYSDNTKYAPIFRVDFCFSSSEETDNTQTNDDEEEEGEIQSTYLSVGNGVVFTAKCEHTLY